MKSVHFTNKTVIVTGAGGAGGGIGRAGKHRLPFTVPGIGPVRLYHRTIDQCQRRCLHALSLLESYS